MALRPTNRLKDGRVPRLRASMLDDDRATGPGLRREIVYLVRWDSYQQLADTWSAFFVDPEWVQVKQDSERDGPVVSAVRRRFLNTNPFERQGGDG